METKKRSGKQKALLVLSILSIIGAVFTLFMGIGMFIGSDAIATLAGQSSGAVAMNGGLILLDGVIMLLMGIFGIRGARDADKIGPYIVFALLGFVMALFFQEQTGGGLIRGLMSGNFSPSALISAIVMAIMVTLGYSIRQDNQRR